MKTREPAAAHGRLCTPPLLQWGGVAFLASLALSQGCSDDCCTFDGEPVSLSATSDGALWARIRDRSTQQVGWALIDTSSPVNLWNGTPGGGLQEHAFDLLAADAPAPLLRGSFKGLWAQPIALTSPPTGLDAPVLAVLGGEFLRRYTPTFQRPAGTSPPTLTIWDRQPASTGFLDTAKYAVLEMNLLGGGQLNAKGEPDIFGIRGPHQFPGSQVVLRGCAAPRAFVPDAETLPACCRGQERALATGVDVSLALATGVGGVLISESAWARVFPALGQPNATPADAVPIFHPAHPQVIVGRRASLPNLALVNLETSAAQDPGACVELGRARRTELVAISQGQSSSVAHCPEPCDRDTRDASKGVASAAYVELKQGIEVLVIPDNSAILQAVRAEIRPEGPEIDGLLGASALKSLRIELDYRPRPARVIVSCEAGSQDQCRAVGRCPRLPNKDSTRVCFDVATVLRLPVKCDNDRRPECATL